MLQASFNRSRVSAVILIQIDLDEDSTKRI